MRQPPLGVRFSASRAESRFEIGPVERLPGANTVHHPYGGYEHTPRAVNLGDASRVNGPITVAIVDDYDVVVMGLANMVDQYSDRVIIAELDTNEALLDTVDIAL